MMERFTLGLIKVILLLIITGGCSAMSYKKTVEYVDIERFMGDWYVIAGRVTFLEKGAHNPLEKYSLKKDKEKIKINIEFSYNKNSLNGPKKSIPQKGEVFNYDTNAHWKVSPFWPLKFDFLVIDLDKEHYEWTAIGVPSQKYLWIMFRDPHPSQSSISDVINRLDGLGYNVKNIEYFKHN